MSDTAFAGLCGQNGGWRKPWKKTRAKASLALSMFDTVDSLFFEPSREIGGFKKSISVEIGDKRIVFS